MSHPGEYRVARDRMVKNQLIPRGITDVRVRAAMRKVPRDRFVEEALMAQAYNDHPLPIGYGQTISQPYMVGLMTQALELKGRKKALEIGTGCGYQAAVLAELCNTVYSVERVRPLLIKARKTLSELGYDNVLLKACDGSLGWKEYEPFDAVIVTAAAPRIPRPLLEQLSDGGRMVIPLGDSSEQVLIRLTRQGNTFTQQRLIDCRFVNLIGVYGWKPQVT